MIASLDLLFNVLDSTIKTSNNNLPYNVSENEDYYEVDVIIPGVEKEKIVIEYRNNILTITCDQKIPDKNYIVKNFDNQKQSLQLKIYGISFKDGTGEYENGILKLVIPKEANSSERLLLK